ncbi:hypothetical protein JTE90_025528 [Oedothorax gibbosus]|uniref:Uncharacterized protein n=1 Tax=Oedothorax gibbosus TaxID=931172 RepID=A0AAV6TVI7_9ARAC|nr:hypothetical protein JTE90_025528 [Oedothorax gibbosus]
MALAVSKIGKGHAALETIAGFLNMNSLSSRSFTQMARGLRQDFFMTTALTFYEICGKHSSFLKAKQTSVGGIKDFCSTNATAPKTANSAASMCGNLETNLSETLREQTFLLFEHDRNKPLVTNDFQDDQKS